MAPTLVWNIMLKDRGGGLEGGDQFLTGHARGLGDPTFRGEGEEFGGAQARQGRFAHGSGPFDEEADVVGQETVPLGVDVDAVQQPEDGFHGLADGQGPGDHIQVLATFG